MSSEWIKARGCESAHCVELRAGEGDAVFIRTTSAPPILFATREEVAVFLAGVKAGDFDHLVEPGC